MYGAVRGAPAGLREGCGGIVGRVKNSVAHEHRLRLLRIIGDGCGAEGCVASIKELAAAGGLTPACARSALRALVRTGLVRTVHRTYPDGGNAANAYFLTPEGTDELVRERRMLEWRV